MYIYIYMFGILLYFINPVQFPLHEPYFDLTLIRVTHTKININIYKPILHILYININQTYCTYSFQRLTSSQYLSEIKSTVTYLFTITSNSSFMQSNYRLQFLFYPTLWDQLKFAFLHPFVQAYVARLQPTILRP